MIKKRVKKIFSLLGLITVRQLWKLADNLYSLITTPTVTIRKLWKYKDKSQIFLVALSVFSPILLYIGARIVWDYYRYKHTIMAGGAFFIAAGIIELIFIIYIVFWITKSSKRE